MPDSAQSSHPGVAQLGAFALGNLAGAERAALQAHLAECSACRQALASLPKAAGGESVSEHETLATVGLVRPAPPPPGGTSQVSDSPALGATAAYRPESNVPADLANHPKFEILQLLGQGGMGAVYKARHKVMNRLVAIKVINAHLVANSKAVERFHREVQAAAKLDHPNIVRAHDADQAGATHFLVMEFVEGTDLAKYVEKKGPLPVAHACHFIRQAALGLQHAHERGMVHRDIKPHNLMLTAGGVVKVMDFGLALLAREGASEAGLTGDNVLMGTADYIAPEQAKNAHKADIRADIYSLGCSLYHLLVGQPPFAGGSVVQKIAAHLITPMPLAELPATTPQNLRSVVAKMVEKDPANRYQTPGEVAQVLLPLVKKQTTQPVEVMGATVPLRESPEQRAGVIDGGPVSDTESQPASSPPSTKKSSAKKNRRRRQRTRPGVAIAVGALALVFTASLLFLLFKGDPQANEMKKFQGTWIVATFEMAGVLLPVDEAVKVIVEIKGSKKTVFLNGKEVYQQEFTIDPTKSPKHFDTIPQFGDRTEAIPGIYAFDRDTLTICTDGAGRDRPIEFRTTKDTLSRSLIVYKRTKPR